MPFAIPFIISFVIGLVLNLVLAVLSSLFAKKPKRANVGFDDVTASELGSDDPWEIVFGAVRKGGTILYKRSTVDKQNMWLVIALAGHQCEAVEDIWLGNESMPVDDGDGSVSTGTYSGSIFVFKHLGEDDQTVDTNLKAAFGDDWTDFHRLRGHTYIVVRLIFNTADFGSGIPNISVNMRGYNQIFDPRTGENGYSDNPILCARAFLVNTRFGLSIPELRIDDNVIMSEATVCDEMVAVPRRHDVCFPNHAKNFTAVAATDILTYAAGGAWFSGRLVSEGLRHNDPVQFMTTGILPGGLSLLTTFFARPLSNNTFQVTASADSDVIVDITSAGSGTHTVLLQTFRCQLSGDIASYLGDVAGDFLDLRITTAGREIPLLIPFPTHFQVRKSTSATTLSTPLAENTDYYGFNQGTPTIYTSTAIKTEGPEGPNVNITAAGSASALQLIKLIRVGAELKDIDLANSMLGGNLGLVSGAIGSSFYTGDLITFEEEDASTTVTLPTPLVFTRTYYVINNNITKTGIFTSGQVNWIQVAASYSDALAGKNIAFSDRGNIGDAGFGNTYILGVVVPQSEMVGLATGTRLRIHEAQYTLPVPFVVGRDYFAINRGRSIIDLAETLEDAIAGNPLLATANGSVDGTRTGPGNGFIMLQVNAERRYVANGVMDTDQEYGNILKGILSACAGRFAPPGDMWRLYAGTWRVSSTTLDRHSLISDSADLQTRIPLNESFNTISGVFRSPVHFDVPSSFTTIVDEDAKARDGEERTKDIALPFTSSVWTAQRLALIELRRAQFQRTLKWTTDLNTWELMPGSVVETEHPGLLLDGISFEIMNIDFTVQDPGDGEGPIPMLTYSTREVDPSIWFPPFGAA